jgi:hypothetical protein
MSRRQSLPLTGQTYEFEMSFSVGENLSLSLLGFSKAA